MKIIVPLVVDEKMANINDAARVHAIELELLNRRSPRGAFFAMFSRLLSGNAPDAIMVRYLNSPIPIVKACNWWMFTTATVTLARLWGVKILWLLHNVDRETIQPYAMLTGSIRCIIGALSAKIFVTDPMLVDVARKHLPRRLHTKLDYITYGERRTSSDRLLHDVARDESDVLEKIIYQIRARDPRALIGFCPTAGGKKFLHLQYASQLLMASNAIGTTLHLVIVGDLASYLHNNRLLEKEFRSDTNICLIDRHLNYDPKRVSRGIDFYWRALSDESVSYTLYEAASVRRPILTLDCGFLGKAVPGYHLGACLTADMSNIREGLATLRDWEPDAAAAFLQTHSWAIAAKKIAQSL